MILSFLAAVFEKLLQVINGRLLACCMQALSSVLRAMKRIYRINSEKPGSGSCVEGVMYHFLTLRRPCIKSWLRSAPKPKCFSRGGNSYDFCKRSKMGQEVVRILGVQASLAQPDVQTSEVPCPRLCFERKATFRNKPLFPHREIFSPQLDEELLRGTQHLSDYI